MVIRCLAVTNTTIRVSISASTVGGGEGPRLWFKTFIYETDSGGLEGGGGALCSFIIYMKLYDNYSPYC